ncbi:MAG TPA: GTP-binding protein [Acidimicrobiales bacterium]|nr:GTP-binding protein [Acidimicrobiales bacterium]
MDLLRFAIIGSVDDGKSTLIGRLLNDTRQLFEDQIAALEAVSRRRGLSEVELAFVTDGLRAEREQGITIDVAYRYAATPRRKLVIADCPGHVQYTRNMATGASNADLAVVVVDASAGLKEQTRRHLCISALLGVTEVLLCVNKMDLVDWSQEAFERAVEEVEDLADHLTITGVTAIPISALHGDNVAEPSDRSPWYGGPTVFEALDSAKVGEPVSGGGRMPVQWVVRHRDGRAYAGMISGGPLRVGEEVLVLPSRRSSRIASLSTFDGEFEEAWPGQSVTVVLADDLDVARGDMLAAAVDPPDTVTELEATVCWFADRPLQAGDRYRVKHTTRSCAAIVQAVEGRLDVNHLKVGPAERLAANDIGLIRLAVATPLAVDSYRRNRTTGSFVIVDESTNATLGAAMVGQPVMSPV